MEIFFISTFWETIIKLKFRTPDETTYNSLDLTQHNPQSAHTNDS